MKRKVLCAAFTFLAFCSVAACGRASKVQSENKRISGMTPQYSASSASNGIGAIQDVFRYYKYM